MRKLEIEDAEIMKIASSIIFFSKRKAAPKTCDEMTCRIDFKVTCFGREECLSYRSDEHGNIMKVLF